ncbi:hypothetical protein M5K25_025369 [Dendrobium thyrsiflorum]|uniref:Uncharacterized protein n=1 Tax=Dendrobium thyrsiflorum TaxID=117978 RepID=A0ABD0U444_DENTH
MDGSEIILSVDIMIVYLYDCLLLDTKLEALKKNIECNNKEAKAQIPVHWIDPAGPYRTDLRATEVEILRLLYVSIELSGPKEVFRKELLKKVLESQTKKMLSEVREVIDSQGSGENPKPIRRREDQKVKILEGTEKMLPLEPIPREESGRGYVERHDGVGQEWRGVEFERRATEFKRIGLDYDRRGAKHIVYSSSNFELYD